MSEVETISKHFELTPEQQVKVTQIQDDLGKDLTSNTKVAIVTACEQLADLGIPKQEICYFICQRAEEWDYSSRHLRRFVPSEYKNQAQRDIRLSHEGGHDGHQREVTPDQIDFVQESPNPDTPTPDKPKSDRISVKKEDFENLKSSNEKLKVENAELSDHILQIYYMLYATENESAEECGEKLRAAIYDESDYKKFIKVRRLEDEREAKSEAKKQLAESELQSRQLDESEIVQAMRERYRSKCPVCKKKIRETSYHGTHNADGSYKLHIHHVDKLLTDCTHDFFMKKKSKSKRISKRVKK